VLLLVEMDDDDGGAEAMLIVCHCVPVQCWILDVERVRYEVTVEPLHCPFLSHGVRMAWSWLSARRSGSCCYGPVSVDTASISVLSRPQPAYYTSIDPPEPRASSRLGVKSMQCDRKDRSAVSTDTGP
jgi:hypothetical protein